VLTDRSSSGCIPVGMNCAVVEMEEEKIREHSRQAPSRLPGSDHLAYVIYTSGSTGRPKGVMIEHRSVVNISKNWYRYYEFDKSLPVVLSIASFSFDVFTGDMCRALLNGGTLVLTDGEKRFDTTFLYTLLVRHKVSVLESTPALIVGLIKHIDSLDLAINYLKLLIVGSDLFSIKDYEYLYGFCHQREIRLINSYGVTEATIDSSYYEGSEGSGSAVPIGKPMDNICYYLTDAHLKLLPGGVPGEICIGGAGVARGYLNQKELTEERFVRDPFSRSADARMYRTGDMGRWLADGNLEYLGRMDDQVKIRGYRIELGEIEKVLLDMEGVSRCVVAAKADAATGYKKLVGYVEMKGAFVREAIISYLRRSLPEYMVPSMLVEVKEMPLTPNGKINRKSLLTYETGTAVSHGYTGARNHTEEVLVAIWEELLGVSPIGIHDNFFELGGHSLLIMRVMSAIRKQLQTELSMKIFFQLPTVELIARYINLEEHNNLVDADQYDTIRL
jgi:amino acid adenylation domain-containing protein